MRITYVLPSPDLGGGNKVVFQHAELLAERGHRVTILGDGPPPDWTGLTLPYLDYSQGRPDLSRQDLVVTTFWTTIERALYLDLGPIAHFCQGYEGGHLHYRGSLEAIEQSYGRPHPNLTVTPYLAELLEERFGNPGRVVPPPLDRRFRPRRFRRGAQERPWIVIPGVYGAQVKGVEVAWEAVELLRLRGLDCRVLRLSTIPPCDAERQRYTADRFLAGVRPEVVAEELPGCDLVLMPSEPEEGFGLPLLEAMAAGVPAVASRIPSTVFMADGEVALVPVGDADALANDAETLLCDRRRWRQARRRGLQAAERFAPSAVADMLDTAVRWAAKVAQNGSHPPAVVKPRVVPSGLKEKTPVKFLRDPEALHGAYQNADPFPHIAIDNLFPDEVLERVVGEFPQGRDGTWRHFDNPQERKSGFDYRAEVGRDLQDFLVFLNSAPALEFLEKLTGIDGLIPDPYFGGAGPHQSFRDGFLKIHADFNWHPKLKLDRRINLLVYLNRDWKEEYGGHLELWDEGMTRCEQRILPVFNRTVVFNTTDTSWHGHPHPLACPEGDSRKSVSMYYYTNGRPEAERSAPHDTIFKPIPGEE